ncbi:excalibur calcium-binding domain-containing protein [Flavobacterium sp. ASV13]|uniref:excalibur calcium-binding domain-containing protein n=1 Tax=Flavobacterium sp. ASV13 TaxID=1506583 RepID=UPI000550CB06|nr:excalibur calcium-binding domain-containing protein [Flavobacterium sp. ASV13]
MKHKKITILLFSLLSIIAFSISCSDSGETSSNSNTSSNCPTKTCGDFATRAQAQAAYNNNKSCYKNLDADGDGIACENLK